MSYQNARNHRATCSVPYSCKWLFNHCVVNNLDIHLYDIDDTGMISIYYDFKKDLFTLEEIDLLHERLMEITKQIMANPELNIKELEIVSAKEKHYILDTYNHKKNTDTFISVYDLFRQQLQKNPNKLAINYKDISLSYKELNTLANLIASKLKEYSVHSGDIVCLAFTDSIEFVASILATQKLGVCYIPIDVNYPNERIEYIVNNSNAKLILTHMNTLKSVKIDKELILRISLDNFDYQKNDVYNIDYERAMVMTNDIWKEKVNGIPHNSFLLSTPFNPMNYGQVREIDRQVILLRVTGSSKLPQDDEMIKMKIDNFQNQDEPFDLSGDKDYDPLTKNKVQFGGLVCRVVGTFYMRNDDLVLGSDIETFYMSTKLNVFMPKGEALRAIVNYVDPIREANSKKEFLRLGVTKEVEPFKIGTVRYTSTDRLNRNNPEDLVPFMIQPSDFLARRTAVLGMTRTGKSNMIKQTVSVVKKIMDKCGLKIGQIIFDINGEYANANKQDEGSIAELYKNDCVRYRMVNTPGFKPLLNNFYEQIVISLS